MEAILFAIIILILFIVVAVYREGMSDGDRQIMYWSVSGIIVLGVMGFTAWKWWSVVKDPEKAEREWREQVRNMDDDSSW